MFNRTTVYEGSRYPGKVEITERRAPTDDSIRIYKELEQKALDSVFDIQANSHGQRSFAAIYENKPGLGVELHDLSIIGQSGQNQE